VAARCRLMDASASRGSRVESRHRGSDAALVQKISRSGEIDWMRAANSSRRLRLASVSRSAAWSDFFSAADPTSLTGARPAQAERNAASLYSLACS